MRPIGVGEVLRRIVGKVIVSTLRNDIITSVGPLQVCARQESGCEAAVHDMSKMYKEEHTKINSDGKMVAYADHFSAADSISSLKYWWDTLCELGPKFGYFPEPTKSWLIVKSDCSGKAIHIFNDTNIQITRQGRRHLGAALDTSQFRNEYIMEKINKWVEELHVLSEIAKIEPQAVYMCFLSGYKHKFNYYTRTIPDIGKLLRKLDEVILTEFIPAITGGILITENERKLLSLTTDSEDWVYQYLENYAKKNIIPS